MAALEGDFIRVHLVLCPVDIKCRRIGFDWPPPERIYVGTNGTIREALEGDDEKYILECTNKSSLSDEDVGDSQHIVRGAEYRYLNISEGF